MHRITSSDGTQIAYERSGDGPPLLLVHGTSGDHMRWQPILPQLEARFTVYAMDRRGRGASGDSAVYHIEQEFADVAAVIESIGGQVNVLGHSFGALCALEAATRTHAIRTLVLYEPVIPIPPGTVLAPAQMLADLQDLIDAGAREQALELFLRELVQIPAEQVAAMREGAAWQGRLAAVHTVVREQRAENAYVFVPERFAQLRVPTVLLCGDQSLKELGMASKAVAAVLPNVRVVTLQGQGHIAMNTAPDLFLQVLFEALGTRRDP